MEYNDRDILSSMFLDNIEQQELWLWLEHLCNPWQIKDKTLKKSEQTVQHNHWPCSNTQQ